ncbi:MAG: hypothetical protein ACOZAM_29100 [Pseudomonadota bacterium]
MTTKLRLLKQLNETRRLVDRGNETIAEQRKIVSSLSGAGHDTTQAEQLLDTFELTQDVRLSEMNTLLNDLDEPLGRTKPHKKAHEGV